MAKTKTSILILLLFFASCTANRSVIGMYAKNEKDFKQSITLNKDSTFLLAEEYFEVNSKCQGRWRYINKNTLLLVCDTEDLTAQLTSGYMSERNLKVFILNNRKIRLKNITLVRKKE